MEIQVFADLKAMNRRSEPRFDVYYRAKLIPLDKPEDPVEVLLTDISGRGMRLVATQEFPENQMVAVEVGQHLVLAEVRSSVPRGNRFVIGAEKIHTLNLLTLPESIIGPDRIQALVDDYHLRIQFALEAAQDQAAVRPEGETDPSRDSTPPVDVSPPPALSAGQLQSEQQEPNLPAALVVADPVPTSVAEHGVPELPSTSSPVAEIPTETTTAIGTTSASPRMTALPESAQDASEDKNEDRIQDPGLAPPIWTEPAPARMPPALVSGSMEMPYGQTRIIIPVDFGQEIDPGSGLLDGADDNQPFADAEAPASDSAPDIMALANHTLPDQAPADQALADQASADQVLTEQNLADQALAGQALAEQTATGQGLIEPVPAEQTATAKASPSLPPPVQPIWMTPPGGAPLEGQPGAESDPLRALAIQHDLAGTVEPERRNHSRMMAALAAAVVAAVALAALLFGPIRNRAILLLPFASASEKSVRNNPVSQPSLPGTPNDPASQADPAPTPDGGPAKEATTATSAPAVASAPIPATTPTPAPAPARPSPAATSASPSTPAPATPPAVAPTPASVKGPSTASDGVRTHSSSVRTSAPSWIWACADGKAQAGRVLPGGSALEIEFSHQATVLVGNAGAVEMALDGKPLGPLGPEGRARLVELTPGGFHLASTAGSQDCGNP